jgi:hypothetical protein
MPAESEQLEGELVRAVELLAETFTAMSIRYAFDTCLTNVNYGVPVAARFAPRVASSAKAISTTPMQ